MPRFRLRSGIHAEGGKVYEPGDVIDSVSDLARLNTPGAPPRFEPLAAAVADQPAAERPRRKVVADGDQDK